MALANLEKTGKINLSDYDYKIVIDKSGSMSTNDTPTRISRWEQAKEWSKAIAQKCELYDSDGIDVIIFDSFITQFKNVTSDKVDELFRKNNPGGSTNTAGAIELALSDYFEGKPEVKSQSFLGKMFSKEQPIASLARKPLIIICITDGEPNSQTDLENVIVKATKKLSSDSEIGITFIQVGKDSSARKFLKKLDDDLASRGAKFDIVDCKDYEEMSNMAIEDVLLQAITD